MFVGWLAAFGRVSGFAKQELRLWYLTCEYGLNQLTLAAYLGDCAGEMRTAMVSPMQTYPAWCSYCAAT
jgi:hypothetical protein